MKKILFLLILFGVSGILFGEYFWDFESDPWLQGWTSAKKEQGHLWPYRWEWEAYDYHLRRPPDPGARTMWCSSWEAGSGYLLRDTLYSPVLPDTTHQDSINYFKWFKWGAGYRYRSNVGNDTASVLVRTFSGGSWSPWQQVQYYFGSDYYGQYDSIDISLLLPGVDSFQLGFAYRGGSAGGRDYYFGVDNVQLTVYVVYIPGPVVAPTGPDSVLTGQTYSYNSEVIAGNYEYQFYWDDGTVSSWSASPTIDKTWDKVGTYFIRSRIRDINFPNDSISDWSDSMQVIVVNPNTIYYWGFENNNGGWVDNGREWQWGIPASGPYEANSGYYLWATDLYGNYNLNYSRLKTFDLILSGADSVVLNFWMWYESVQDTHGLNMFLAATQPHGTSWWYNAEQRYYDSIPAHLVSPPFNGSFQCTWTGTIMSGWTGDGRSWLHYQIDLTPYVWLDSIQILWRLADYNDAVGLSGFYLDDVWLDTFMSIPGPVTAPAGTDSGYIESTYPYTSDPVAGGVEYQFDWGDGSLSSWSASQTQDKSWSEVGTYYVRSRVRNTADTTQISRWSNPLVAKMISTKTVYYCGFEFNEGGYTNSRSRDWEWGMPLTGPTQARSGKVLWGTNLDGYYTQNASWLLSPPFNISYSDSAVLYFWMWYESEWNQDAVAIMTQSDSTPNSYENVVPVPKGYIQPPYSGDYYMSWWGTTDPGWTGSGASWQLYSVNLTPFSYMEDLKFLWRLGVNSSVHWDGFYIDDIRIDTFMFPIHGPFVAPAGPNWGLVDTIYYFATDTATSGMGQLEYQFSWGDGTYSAWDTLRLGDHSWSAEGLYQIRARARVRADTTLLGPWSPPHSIEIGTTGYFEDPWTFEPGYQGWTPSSVWQRLEDDYHGATWRMENAEDWTLWAIGTGQVYVHDTTYSVSIGIEPQDKYLIWDACFRNSTSIEGDTAIVIFRLHINTMWREWMIAEMYTERAYPKWYYEDIPSLDEADSFQMAVVYIHTDGTSDDRFFGIDNIRLTSRPFITEIGWNFETSTQYDWVHTNNNNWPNGWEIRSSSTISSLSLPNDGYRSIWIGNTSSHSIPLVDTTFSPADWNPIDVQYLKYGIAFNDRYDSIKVLLSGTQDSVWSEWHELKKYEVGSTPTYKDYDSVDISTYENYSRIALGFAYYSSMNYGAMVIDNITVVSAEQTDALVALPPEAGQQNQFTSAGTYSVSAEIINAGTNPASLTATAMIQDLTDGTIMLEEELDFSNIQYLDTVQANFGSVDLVNGHRYLKKVLIDYPGDNNNGNDTLISVIWALTPVWARIADMPVELSGACTWFDRDGLMHVYGEDVHLLYNPQENSWSYANPLPLKLTSGKSAIANDQVIITGDFDGQKEVMLIYDMTTDASQIIQLPEDIQEPTVVAINGNGDDYIYIIPNENINLPNCYLYEPLSSSFIPCSGLPSGYYRGVAGYSNDRILLSGGDVNGYNFYIGEVNPASPSLINWRTEYKSPVGITSNAFGTSAGDYFLIAGGTKNSLVQKTAYLYDAEYGWFSLPDLPLELQNASSVADFNASTTVGEEQQIARFYLIGGENLRGNSNQVYYLELNQANMFGSSQEQISTSPFAYSVCLASSNVFSQDVVLRLSLPLDANVYFNVFDLSGRKVRTIDQSFPAGINVFRWDGTDDRGHSVSAGSYFFNLDTPWGRETGKLIRVQ
ncbi:MAG: FlgD immunoglobulin-like domain containing protein [bacterium]